MDLGLTGRTALVLGGSKGIGRGIAEALAAEGVVGIDPALWSAQFEAMVLSLIRIADAVLPDMRAQKWGRIMTVASSLVVEPSAMIGVSSALRSTLVGWSKVLASEQAAYVTGTMMRIDGGALRSVGGFVGMG